MTMLLIALVLIPSIFTKTFTAISSKSDAESSITTFSETAEDDLIKRKFRHTVIKYKMEPIDAKIDRVWKAIPGYNGLEVNGTASYNKMKGS